MVDVAEVVTNGRLTAIIRDLLNADDRILQAETGGTFTNGDGRITVHPVEGPPLLVRVSERGGDRG